MLSVYTIVDFFYQVWINQSDIILIGLRDYQDHKADVIMKYSADEARNLKLYGELPDNGNLSYCNAIQNVLEIDFCLCSLVFPSSL